MNLSEKIRSTGSDGAYLKSDYQLTQHVLGSTLVVWTHPVAHAGAEHRPIPVTPPLPIAPVPRPRSPWPAVLAAAAIVFALDRGNVGAALLVGIWLYGWAQR